MVCSENTMLNKNSLLIMNAILIKLFVMRMVASNDFGCCIKKLMALPVAELSFLNSSILFFGNEKKAFSLPATIAEIKSKIESKMITKKIIVQSLAATELKMLSRRNEKLRGGLSKLYGIRLERQIIATGWC